MNWSKYRHSGEKTECKYNSGVECCDQNCAHCGWNPKVDEQRRRKFALKKVCSKIRASTRERTVKGLVATMQGIRPAPLTLSVSENENGESLALEYSGAGIVLAIPIDTVCDMVAIVR